MQYLHLSKLNVLAFRRTCRLSIAALNDPQIAACRFSWCSANYFDYLRPVSGQINSDTFFTPDTHEHHLHTQVKLADQVLPLENKPKVLGVTLDTHLTFTQHCNNIAVKVQQRNDVLKALAGSTLGCDKEA